MARLLLYAMWMSQFNYDSQLFLSLFLWWFSCSVFYTEPLKSCLLTKLLAWTQQSFGRSRRRSLRQTLAVGWVNLMCCTHEICWEVHVRSPTISIDITTLNYWGYVSKIARVNWSDLFIVFFHALPYVAAIELSLLPSQNWQDGKCFKKGKHRISKRKTLYL